MKLFIFLSVVFVEATSFYLQNNVSTHEIKLRQKRQDDRWIWGYVNAPMTQTQKDKLIDRTGGKTDAPTTTEEYNPCDEVIDEEIPDFRAPGRRISEVKCYEYIYDIKLRERKDEKNAACKQYNKDHGMDTGFGVIGGGPANDGQFPHMAAIGWKAVQDNWLFKCGGSLISQKFVLTAAHCTKASDRDTTLTDVVPKIVRFGHTNIFDYTNIDANIIRIIQHPEYNAPKKYFDIALFETDFNFVFSKSIQPACLYTGPDNTLVGKDAFITGWGVVNTVTRETAADLQFAKVDVISSSQCDSLLLPSCNRHWCGMQDHQLCAGRLSGGVDACQGDSGGPLQVNITLPRTTKGLMYHIIGVTSFGIGCAQPELPGIYTKVSSFLDWIESNVWQ